MKTKDSIISTCNALLRGELSAIETYNQAIEKYGDNSGDNILESIREDHEASADALRELIGETGETPATSSGPWGTFATAVEGVATLFGESPALVILQHGEIHGISVYEKALEDEDIDESVKWLIRDELLPALREHLVELERCKSMVSK
jgi:rubrerythrin